MKKFECTRCPHRKCTSILEDDLCSPPQSCVNKYVPLIPDWHEVKAETTTKSSQLPDWCKSGEWYYDRVIKQYLQIDSFDMAHKARWGQELRKGVIVQARKRQFNAKEMRGLLGKVVTNGTDAFLICAYYGETNCVSAGVFAEFCAQYLIDNNFTVYGKPCYVLEHLENGEWVE